MIKAKAHTSVLVREVLQVFEGKEIRLFFDGTVGAGGHASALLEAHPEIERYVGCDRDPTALALAGKALEAWGEKVELVRGDYADMPRMIGKDCIDGFLIDIGVSSMQLDERERGFSFMGDAPLDMRMDPEGELTAAEVVNRYGEAELARIFFEYGEERRSRQVAKAIVEARRKRKIRTTGELVEIIKPVATRGRLHPATLVFQALRIVVNDELGQLQRGLTAAIEKTCPEGRIAAISFHSLEDRIVKNAFRDAKGVLKILTKKPIGPTAEETRANPRSRSAKLRAAEKLGSI
ncbi:MAG TPA: 16S rRNA (cytosine(1402)-N(4))-methyltransferase RsmH [Chlamydiales bacterium]|nr:16S rRNA (cytosine(1402)-N(4))-methyltransferase RsmH [Chlamydiales bacterium]